LIQANASVWQNGTSHDAPPTARFALDTWRSIHAIAPQSAVAVAVAANAASAANYFRGEAPQGAAVAKGSELLSWGAALAGTAAAKGLVAKMLNDIR
jgi:hypothetical protein